jgi:hypothetical protein
MDDRFEVADPSEMLDAALGRLDAKGCKALVVVRDGRISGVVTHQGVVELVMMRRAAQSHL